MISGFLRDYTGSLSNFVMGYSSFRSCCESSPFGDRYVCFIHVMAETRWLVILLPVLFVLYVQVLAPEFLRCVN